MGGLYFDLKENLNHVPGGGGANGEMANLTNEKGKFAIAIFRHFSPFFAIFRHFSPLVVFEIKHFRNQGN